MTTEKFKEKLQNYLAKKAARYIAKKIYKGDITPNQAREVCGLERIANE